MSAFITSHEHTLALAQAIVNHVKPIGFTTQQVYNALLRENYKSVNHRYNERSRPPKTVLTAEEILQSPRVLNHIDLFKLAQSQDYQSCEHPGWHKSKPYLWLTELQVKMAYKMLCDTPAYSVALWTI